MSWFWCLEHGQAEENMGCAGHKRMGPYKTAEQAAMALKRINHREAQAAAAPDEKPKARPQKKAARR